MPSNFFLVTVISVIIFLGLLLPGCTAQKDLMNPSIKFEHKEYNDQNELVMEGQSFKNGIRNGFWRFYNSEGQIVKTAQYKEGEIHGMVSEEIYKPGIRRKMEGVMIDGKRVGMWVGYSTGGKKWRKTHFVVLNDEGKEIARSSFHENGVIALEYFFDTNGKKYWYKSYNKQGALIAEGEEIPSEIE